MNKKIILTLIISISLLIMLSGCSKLGEEQAGQAPYKLKKPVSKTAPTSAKQSTTKDKVASGEIAPATESESNPGMPAKAANKPATIYTAYARYSAKVYKIDPILTPTPEFVVLKNLDDSGYLRGKYIDVVNYCGSEPDGCIAGSRVYSSSNIYIYEPIEYGEPNYFGSTDATDQGHQFDETMSYYAGDTISQYFRDNFNYEYPIKITIKLYEPFRDEDLDWIGVTDVSGNIFIPRQHPGPVNYMRDVKGIMHEYTHNVYHQFVSTPSTVLDEGYAIYLPSSIVDDSRYSLYLNPRDPKNIDNSYSGNDNPFAFAAALWDVRRQLGRSTTDELIFESWDIQPIGHSGAVEGMVSLIEASNQKYGLHSATHRINRQIITDAFERHGIVCRDCIPAS
ncbi:hypothetical protein HQ545_05450 [Candidatus Woesearchaeota archaeon]|nr:hypothetical protein [Candidatus Woesearchaeota archaeon]